MKQAIITPYLSLNPSLKLTYLNRFLIVLIGMLGPCGFAPFHTPGLTLMSITLLYLFLQHSSNRQSVALGFLFGMGYFGFGVSWVLVSIHDYGNLNYLIAGIATLLFVAYLALFPALVCYCYKLSAPYCTTLTQITLFSVLWCLSEVLRSSLFSGFPWLLLGTSQIDTPLHYLFPVVGIYGVSLLTVLASTALATTLLEKTIRRYAYLLLFISLLLAPNALKTIDWTTFKEQSLSVAVIQANLAMRDKWDESLFWNLLRYYQNSIEQVLGTDVIILPESAIPLPANYLTEYLQKLNDKAAQAKSSLLLGILQAANEEESGFYNSIIGLGQAQGHYNKRHPVPFGEYIPQPFLALNRWFQVPDSSILPGHSEQSAITVAKHPIATLICYEIAYPELLKEQMPNSEFIVSISDNGWFGHSFARYQHLQIAQTLSLLTGRYHVVVNNDGLSSIINNKGQINDSLPPYSAGILRSSVSLAQGTTPWLIWGDYPVLIFCSFFLVFILYSGFKVFSINHHLLRSTRGVILRPSNHRKK